MSTGPIVWMAGTNWDAVAGTDKCLVRALAKTRPVMWVDPPVPVRRPLRSGIRTAGTAGHGAGSAPRLEQVGDSLLRLKVSAPPGVTRPFIRRITAWWLERTIRAAVAHIAWEPAAVVSAMPLARFPRKTPGLKIVFLTDDWLEGSRLMGLSRAAIRRVLESNLSQADGIAAVSEELLIRLGGFRPADAPAGTATAALTSRGAGRRTAHAVIPNGCPEPPTGMPAAPREPAACLVGQLNERLDLDVLEAVQAAGIAMTVIGPRTDRSPAYGRRLDAFLAAENVHWMGQLSADELRGQLTRFGVGLTPYADSSFNRASFPLKTLEYLSAGLAVVSTDMPSARWLNTGLISLHSDPEEFALAVRAALAERTDRERERLRKQFAAGHTWAARAVDFQRLLDRADHHRARHRAGPLAAITAGKPGEEQT